jgi:hypothetical protein
LTSFEKSTPEAPALAKKTLGVIGVSNTQTLPAARFALIACMTTLKRAGTLSMTAAYIEPFRRVFMDGGRPGIPKDFK